MKPKLHPLFKENWISPNQELEIPAEAYHGCRLFLKREDLVDPYVSGNKFRKLRYNLSKAINDKQHTLFTFGGAHSNHIAAVARAARLCNLNSIGIIRGDELHPDSNPTLSFATQHGMRLHFISRNAYRNRNELELLEEFAPNPKATYLLPEGGTNQEAIQGCEEILTTDDASFNYICTAVGTGGTLAGILRSAAVHQKVIGFSVLKGDFQREGVSRYTSRDYLLTSRYCFGGYAKIDETLLRFINDMNAKHQLRLDPVYTAKMLFGVLDMIREGAFGESASILAIHTGGLQGVAGMNQRLLNKKRPQIEL